MFDRSEIRVVPPGRRWAAQLELWIDGEELTPAAVGEGGRGPYAAEALAAAGDGSLWASGAARRVVLGEPECTGGCCGFLSAVVRRARGLVEWSGWETCADEPRPPECHFDADQYDAELARAAEELSRLEGVWAC
ncbi:hypothetical protein ABT095_00430 [Kitasatospora sp. NPDC002227]|uniref:hypothetical protein n=1 Tax=Kitasatospora sp. NPDC002227 TaxID=3154773 RepID=UPI00331746A8